MTNKKSTPSALNDADLEATSGGDKVSYLLNGDIKAAYKPAFETVDNFDLAGRRDIGSGGTPLPTEEIPLGYTEVEWNY